MIVVAAVYDTLEHIVNFSRTSRQQRHKNSPKMMGEQGTNPFFEEDMTRTFQQTLQEKFETNVPPFLFTPKHPDKEKTSLPALAGGQA